MAYIEGTDRRQLRLFSLEDMVPQDSIVRVVDNFVNNCNLAELGFDTERDSVIGRPSYNPADMTKLILYGYISGRTSSRKLEAETVNNFEAKWLVKYLTPNHTTISEFRRTNSSAIRNLLQAYNNEYNTKNGQLIIFDEDIEF